MIRSIIFLTIGTLAATAHADFECSRYDIRCGQTPENLITQDNRNYSGTIAKMHVTVGNGQCERKTISAQGWEKFVEAKPEITNITDSKLCERLISIQNTGKRCEPAMAYISSHSTTKILRNDDCSCEVEDDFAELNVYLVPSELCERAFRD